MPGSRPPTITRLTAQWQDEAKTFGGRDLSGTDYVYLWVDGIHLKVRLDQDEAVLAGDARGACRWPQGARRPG